jgi:serine/threonine protein kinase
MEPFPGYRLRRRRGTGGYAEVWEATSPLGYAVALKFLRLDEERATARELRSLQIVRQLHHPHLIRIHQVWCYLGYIVVAMELADASLAELLTIYQSEFGTPIVAEMVCLLLSEAAQALDFLNTRQHKIDGNCIAIQHCDVKPSNLLVIGNKVKVTDFGISSRLASWSDTRSRAGTLDFCARRCSRAG